MVCNTLIETLADVSIILRRRGLAVTYCVAPLRTAAVRDAGTNVLVVAVRDRELVIELVVETEQPCSDINLVVVVRTSAKTIRPHEDAGLRRSRGKHRGLVRVGNLAGDRQCHRTEKWIACQNHVGVRHWTARGRIKAKAIANQFSRDDS